MVRDMDTNVSLSIGTGPMHAKYHFTDRTEWGAVRTQILAAVEAGKGLIEIVRTSDTVVYVYGPHLAVSWIEDTPPSP